MVPVDCVLDLGEDGELISFWRAILELFESSVDFFKII